MEPQKIMLVTYRIFQYALLLLLPTVILINLSSCSANTYGNETDHLALLEFKSQIGDDPYGVLSSWNETRPHCEWRGVMCSQRHQRVTALELREQSLSGSISPHIGNISFLRYIDLSSNNLNGEIPQEIGCLFQLRHLNLSKNTLGGAIPVNLSHCTEFKTLDLSYNEHTGELPLDLGSLNKLIVLRLDQNNLSGEIPHSFGNLSSLEEMHMGYNKLQGSLRKELSKLTSLIFLQIGGNNLTGIMPPSMYNLSSINMFAIAENQLAGNLPTNIGSTLPNLELFYIDYNLFSGTIPASFGNASKLKEFDISRNTFVGKVPNNIGYLSGLQYINIGTNQLGSNSTQDLSFLVPLSNCSNLNTLSFFRNNIGGQIPNSIGNFSVHMGQLHMGYNQISGPIPEAFGSLTNLYFLGMDRNLLSGAIPSFIGRFQKLQRLLLNENQFSGEIPSSLGNLSQIEDLILNSNRLEGKIPESIGNCRKLQYLELADNNLHGIIPPQVCEIPFLLVIYLSTNSLSGPLPARAGKLISINYLGISANNLSGEIPMSIGDCLSQEYLDMEENSFSGSIPSSLSSLKGIQFLDLSQNNLSGKIPKVLESLVYLQYLNLSFNNLEGNVPTKNVFGNASAISVVGNSKLCGGIAKLELPPCPIPQVKKQNKISFASKLIIALVSLIFFLILVTSFGFLHWKRNKTKVLITSLEEGKFMKISYRELYQATDRFSSENAIGSGSFGSVYRGKLHHQADKLIAVKVLNLQNTRASKSFLAECKILRNVRHRNLVKLLTYCSSMDSERNDFKALVYEFMPNGNLDLWLHPDEANRSKTLTLVQRLEVAIDIASALEYLHCHCEAPIIHCDLKPSNILLDDDMGARVGDFGLARFCPKVTNDVSEISSIGIKGSIGYAAPEYGTGSEVSLKGDVYSYGIILLEMMTGRRPTDDFFKDGLDIHNYVQKAFPKQVNLIMDPVLGREQEIEPSKEEELGQNNDGIEEIGDHGGKVGSSSPRIKWKNCIMSILAIGLACSKESPAQRIDMNDVHMELYRIKGALLGCGRNRL